MLILNKAKNKKKYLYYTNTFDFPIITTVPLFICKRGLEPCYFSTLDFAN